MVSYIPRPAVTTPPEEAMKKSMTMEIAQRTRTVDVHMNGLLRALRLQEEQLGDDQTGQFIGDRAHHADDPLFEQPRIDIVRAFATACLLDHHGYQWEMQIRRNMQRRPMDEALHRRRLTKKDTPIHITPSDSLGSYVPSGFVECSNT